ncbi:hypothetical protein OIU76_003366 [Salix suchowensis]|nr:hypothetical protein OIU76_003366 [Salix suchowensis]
MADHNKLGFSARRGAPPPLVSLSPFSAPTSPLLSSQFKPSQAVPSPRRLPWVDLQEQLVNEWEAGSDIAIGIGLNRDENVDTELFSQIQRFLVVAALWSCCCRDEVLSSMDQKLDNLCDQINTINKQEEIKANDAFGGDRIEFVDRGSWHCYEHQEHVAGLMGKSAVRMPGEDEVLRCKMPFGIEREPEEQQMSDFSDWGSTGSAEEIQTNTFAIDQDMFNLKKEFEEKDATKEELSTDLQSFAGSKRIAELEDIICRKNSMIKRLKRDMVVLEQKADHSPRLRRPSYSLSIPDNWELPVMVENILYDLDSSSSSDSDSSPSSQPQHPSATIQETSVQSDVLTFDNSPETSSGDGLKLSAGEDIRKIRGKGGELHSKSRAEIHPKETSRNQKSAGPSTSKPEKVLAGGDGRKIRRQTQSSSKDTAPKKRWL